MNTVKRLKNKNLQKIYKFQQIEKREAISGSHHDICNMKC